MLFHYFEVRVVHIVKKKTAKRIYKNDNKCKVNYVLDQKNSCLESQQKRISAKGT